MNSKIVALIAVAVVVVGGFLILRSSGVDVETGLDALNVNSLNPASETVPSNVKEFTVTGSNFAFAPKALSVNKGDTVKITFVNSVGMHDLRLDEFNAKTAVLQAGKSETITFVADKSGTFEYYCSVGSHRQMGMVGTLTVQ